MDAIMPDSIESYSRSKQPVGDTKLTCHTPLILFLQIRPIISISLEHSPRIKSRLNPIDVRVGSANYLDGVVEFHRDLGNKNEINSISYTGETKHLVYVEVTIKLVKWSGFFLLAWWIYTARQVLGRHYVLYINNIIFTSYSVIRLK